VGSGLHFCLSILQNILKLSNFTYGGTLSSPLCRFFKLAHNVLRVGDVALCCACGKVMALARCYGLG
jgi:hypothetical protein